MPVNTFEVSSDGRVPKLFRLQSKLERIVRDMKLNKTKVRFILLQYRKHVSTKEILRDVKVSQRRVKQIIKEHKETGLETVLGEKAGRPAKPHNYMNKLNYIKFGRARNNFRTTQGHPATKKINLFKLDKLWVFSISLMMQFMERRPPTESLFHLSSALGHSEGYEETAVIISRTNCHQL